MRGCMLCRDQRDICVRRRMALAGSAAERREAQAWGPEEEEPVMATLQHVFGGECVAAREKATAILHCVAEAMQRIVRLVGKVDTARKATTLVRWLRRARAAALAAGHRRINAEEFSRIRAVVAFTMPAWDMGDIAEIERKGLEGRVVGELRGVRGKACAL